MFKIKINVLVAGFCLIFVGIMFLKTGYSFLYNHPVPPIAGYICIVIGILFMFFSVFSESSKEKRDSSGRDL